MTIPSGAANGGFAWGDVNGDGFLDVFIPSNNIMLNSSGTTFTASTTMTANVTVSTNSVGCLLADFNGDGVLDLFTTNGGTPSSGLYYNTAGVFTAATGTGDLANAGVTGEVFQGAAVADINHSNYLSITWPGNFTNISASAGPYPSGGGIWLLKGNAGGTFTNLGNGAYADITANIVDVFSGSAIGTAITGIGWSASDANATVAADPVVSSNKVMKVKIGNYNAAPVLSFSIPAGRTLANYNKFIFKGYWAQGDVGYKSIVVEASQSSPTGQAFNNTGGKVQIGSVSRSKGASTAWEYDTVVIANSSSLSGTVYLDFGINCAGKGALGTVTTADSSTQWYADSVTLIGAPAPAQAIDTTLSHEAWQLSFLDANNDGYPDLLMPSFRNGLSLIDTGTAGGRKGCVLYMNDGTGKFIVPNATTLGRPIYSVGASGASTTVDTGIIVDDTVRHFGAIGEQWGDLNNDGNMDLILSCNSAVNNNSTGALVNIIILYGKGDGTFTYKWNGTSIVTANGIVQNGNQRSIGIGDYNNDGLQDIVTHETYSGPVHLYKNNGDGTFTDVATNLGLTPVSGTIRSVQFVDYNNDGFLDVFAWSGGAGGNLLQKSGGNTNHWIGFKPIGSGHNMSAIGARFTVYTGTTKQVRDIKAEAGEGAQGGELRALFGIGANTKVDSVNVRWPDGTSTMYNFGSASNTLAVNKYYTVQEGSIIPSTPATGRPSWASADTSLPSVNTMTWHKVASGAQPLTYQIQIGTNKAMSTILQSFTGLTDTTKSVKLPLATKLYWRVSSWNNDFQSAWSVVDSFRTNMTPVAPTAIPPILSPAVNSTTVPKIPVITLGSISTAYTYHIQIDTLNTFAHRDSVKSYSGLILNDSTSFLDTVETIKSVTFTNSKKYFYRVRGWNAAGASNFSAVDSFTIMFIPAPPSMIYPAHNQANVPVNPLTFKWHTVAGDSNYVVKYWTSTPLGLATVVDTTTPGHDTVLTVNGMENRAKYYWQIQTVNQGGASAFTAVDSFTTVIELPGVPLTISPKSVVASSGKPTFVWNSSANAVWYHLQVATTNFASASDVVLNDTLRDTTLTVIDTLQPSFTYYWHVSAINLGGESAFSTSAHFTTPLTSVQTGSAVPKEFALNQNYPNPFNPSTMISYDLPKSSYVKLQIYDVLGRLVTTLVDGVQPVGRQNIQWNAGRLSSGVYIYRLHARSQDGASDFTSSKKLLLMK
ncbi:MAG TPA: FG-GAP-like repeat-containing protein [Bacteroidota bacterium]|nr:FG-GAP-like repeat-containing protein [Bacteroidota bacterium]